eukprot:TRINITY_DN47637_c0_g2_i1.p1 TRINITY_DN47637_c0_g2~~TRINITY_DN47637_c0_g2_i1.p1  ORF type:complete len:493 (-),score=100.33 TRINITY_DN47637_c0_g2_i1:153-1577(-)
MAAQDASLSPGGAAAEATGKAALARKIDRGPLDGAPRKRLRAQVLHRRVYGNRLAFFDVHEHEDLAPAMGTAVSSTAGSSASGDDNKRDDGNSQEPHSSWEVVFDATVYGSDVRLLRKDISPGDVAEFEGSLRPCGRIMDASMYKLITRWRDVAGEGETFVPPVAPTRGEEDGARGAAPPPPAPGADSGLEKRVCKFWISNKDCQRPNCRHAHPEGEDFVEARREYFEEMKRRKVANANPEDPHSAEGKKSHGQRAAVFAEWLCKTYGEERLREQGVLDVAGGRGDISFELAVKRKIPCIVIDPRCPGGGEELQPARWEEMRLSKPQRSWLEANVPGLSGFPACQGYVASCPLTQCKAFVTKSCLDPAAAEHEAWKALVERCCVVVGLHPDQATGGVVDLALAYGKPFAVVPCCTFADDFPERQLDDRPVRTYDDLVEWLKLRDRDVKVDFLSFMGKNLVVFKEHLHANGAAPS